MLPLEMTHATLGSNLTLFCFMEYPEISRALVSQLTVQGFLGFLKACFKYECPWADNVHVNIL